MGPRGCSHRQVTRHSLQYWHTCDTGGNTELYISGNGGNTKNVCDTGGNTKRCVTLVAIQSCIYVAPVAILRRMWHWLAVILMYVTLVVIQRRMTLVSILRRMWHWWKYWTVYMWHWRQYWDVYMRHWRQYWAVYMWHWRQYWAVYMWCWWQYWDVCDTGDNTETYVTLLAILRRMWH